MKSISLLLATFFLGLQIIYPQQTEQEILKKYLGTITIEEVLNYSKTLTSKEFEGRLSGTPGFWKAARWIAQNFEEWGIRPGGDNGSYFQKYNCSYTLVIQPGNLSIQTLGGTEKRHYNFPDDFYSGSHSSSGEIKGEAVYVGYGISAPELGYDDYEGIEVKGKIVVLKPGLPVQTTHPGFENWVYYSYHKNKFAIAKRKGAVGLLYTDKIANTNTIYQEGFVYAQIGEKVVADLFEGTGTTMEKQNNKIISELKPQSMYLNKTVNIGAKTKHNPQATAGNIIGVIEGSHPELKHEVIIIGAHFDGQGMMGDLLFPSALDNASGVANIMAAARAISQSGIQLDRTIMFLFLGAHENGMHGTNFYVENPVFPRENTIAYFNLDMVGNGTGIVIFGGQTHTRLFHHFEENNRLFVNRNLSATPVRPLIGRLRSDGAIFQREGFSALGIGATGRVKEVFYHDHRDNVDVLTPDLMRDVARLIYLSFIGMANDENLKVGE